MQVQNLKSGIKTTNEVAGVLKTDQNGQAESEELLIGSYNEKGIKELFQYEVVETKAPEGYQLDSRPHPVTFDLEGEKDGEILVELDVTNQRIPTDAPKTGDDTVSPIAASWYLCGLYRNTDWMLCLSQKKQETDEKEEKLNNSGISKQPGNSRLSGKIGKPAGKERCPRSVRNP